MSDRLAVMNGGRVEQIGAPQDVYEDPETLFVADFLGVSNLMDADGAGHGRRALPGRGRTASSSTRGGGPSDVTGPAKIVIRPERVELEPHEAASGPEPPPGHGRARGLRRLGRPGSRPRRHRRDAPGARARTPARSFRTSKGLRCSSTCPSMRCACFRRRSETEERGRRGLAVSSGLERG